MATKFEFVPREHVHGTIGGVAFGNAISCIARSPKAVLLWNAGGTGWSGRGQTAYFSSHLIGISVRNAHELHRHYARIGPEGGRLNFDRVNQCQHEIAKLFDYQTFDMVRQAVHIKKTLLVNGGGEALCPARRLGIDAYQEWRRKQRAK